jgi:hypothetical protein
MSEGHIIIIIVGFTIACFIQRYWWRHEVPYYGIDTWYHLLVANKIRSSKYRLPKKLDNYLEDPTYEYPPLFHYILALMPNHIALKLNGVICPLIEAVHCFIVMGFVYILIPSFVPLLLAGAIYILAPILWYQALNLNPRPLATLFVTLALFWMYMFIITSNYVYIVALIITITCIHLTHKFATQVFTFINIAVALYLLSPIFLLSQLIGIAIAIVVSCGHYIKILRRHIDHIAFWMKIVRLKVRIDNFPRGIWSKCKHIASIMRLNPWVLFVIPILSWFIVSYQPMNIFLISALVLILMAILTSTHTLSFLGNDYRYLSYTVSPMAILISIFAMKTLAGFSTITLRELLLIIVIFLIGAYSAYYIYELASAYKIENGNKFILPMLLDACKFIKRLHGKNIITVPLTIHYATAYFTGKNVVSTGMELSKRSPIYSRALPKGSKYDRNLQKLINKYKVNYILVDRTIESRWWELFGKPKFSNERYLVFET